MLATSTTVNNIGNSKQQQNQTYYDDVEVVGEATPLLLHKSTQPNIILTDNDDQQPQQVAVEQQQQQEKDVIDFALMKEKIVTVIAIIGFITSLLSLLVEASITAPTVYVTGILGILLSPYTIIQQRKITEIDALRIMNNKMENEVNILSYDNDQLNEQVNTISISVSNLNTLQSILNSLSILLSNNKSISDIQIQIEQSKLILNRMENNNNCATILQNVIAILLTIDNNNHHDMILSDIEINQLINEIETISDIDIDTEKVRDIIVNQSIKGIIELARQIIINHDPNHPDSIFKAIAESSSSTSLPIIETNNNTVTVTPTIMSNVTNNTDPATATAAETAENTTATIDV